MRLVYSLFFVLLVQEVQSQQSIDMGDLSFVCGLQSNGRTSTQSDRISGSNPLNLRGPKGDAGHAGKQGPPGVPGPQGIPSRPAASCLEHLKSGNTDSGIYSIKPTLSSATTEVYCDMESAGGGWTLVASFHEKNIKRNCSTADNRSPDEAISISDYNALRNWENYYVFGNVESATSGDYKSAAYFNVMASDVMIWHLPKEVEVSQWMNQSFLRYYTNTGFLNNYGGTLQSVFSKHFPLTKSSSMSYGPDQLESVLSSLNGSASFIRSSISNFYSYRYDTFGTHNYIADGGNDMFDNGNMVFYQIEGRGYHQITYGQTYRDWSNNVAVSSIAAHPFFALMWIGNSNRLISTFDLKVQSGSGADGKGNLRTLQGTISNQSFQLSYKILNIYNASDPSISKVFFFIKSNKIWGSHAPRSFASIDWPSITDPLTNTMRVTGSPQSVMMGYTLLSSVNGSQVVESEAREALTRILQIISNFHTIESYDCSRVAESLVVPINYLEGSNDRIVSRMPPSKTTNIPGYIHFRPLSHDGVPNALCPGFKTEDCEPQWYCVGGINTRRFGDPRGCEDFAALDGVTAIDPPNAAAPDWMAHSLNGITSSIFVFTRLGNSSNDTQH